VKFSIVTPSHRPGEWLPLCLASVADQGLDVEHLVQDAGSDDGTPERLKNDPRVRLFVEQDAGMYDAINRGFRRASGDVLAWLNCDEQYLPGALRRAGDFLAAHPEVDVLFGDVVVVNEDGDYLCHRKMLPPLRCHTWTCHLATLSCGMFVRRRVVAEHGLWLDARFRYAGDAEWMLRVLERGLRTAVLGEFTSVFTVRAGNLSRDDAAAGELLRLRPAPFWLRALKPAWILHHRLRRWRGGAYSQAPFSFELFTRASPDRRVERIVTQPTFRWRAW
jgi:glycosyltransferase involved in cell wall biosynthesis